MRLTFWFATKGYEMALGPLLTAGAAAHGDEIVMRPLEEYRGPTGDGGLICGVVKREVLWEHQARGVPLLYLDKGYHRAREHWRGLSLPAWWRLCWNAVHPTAYLMDRSRPSDRWQRLGVHLQERRPGKQVVILGSSAKFHETERLVHPTSWAKLLVAGIKRAGSWPIVYRPKPSWADAVAVDGATFDHGSKTEVAGALRGAWCSVTHGSIACVDSIVAGVPCVVLGQGVARPISSTTMAAVADPYWPPRAIREQWAANLAYCHFTPAEIETGHAWKILKEQAPHAV